MIKSVKNYEGSWTVWNTVTHNTAEVVRIEEYGYLARNTPKRYRVDVSGRTVASMVDNFQTAKGIAASAVR